MGEQLSLPDLLADFPPEEPIRAVVFMTYGWDGELVGEHILPSIDRPAEIIIALRDGRRIGRESPDVNIRRIDMQRPAGVFHAKLALIIGARSARAVIGSANLTRGGQQRNAEIARTFDLGRSTTHRQVFIDLVKIIASIAKTLAPVHQPSLALAMKALSTVLQGASREGLGATHFLANESECLWDQLRDIAGLKQRHIGSVHIVSPFFDAAQRQAGAAEDDPGDTAGAGDWLARLSADLRLPPGAIHIYTEEGAARAAATTLGQRAHDIAWHLRDPAEKCKRLHGKLMILCDDPAHGTGAVVVLGSANATRAAWLCAGRDGNQELVAVTLIDRSGEACAREHLESLGLDRDFTRSSTTPLPLSAEEVASPPLVPGMHITAAVLGSDGTSCQVWLADAPSMVRSARIEIGDGAQWPVRAQLGHAETFPWLARIEAMTICPESGMRMLQGNRVLVTVIDGAGDEHRAIGSLNVSDPDAFVGPRKNDELDLDRRMERETSSLQQTYRDRCREVVGRIRRKRSGLWKPSAATHQGDLDATFHRCRGALQRIHADWRDSPQSLSVLLRSFRRLADYFAKTVDDASGLTPEARLWLGMEIATGLLDLLGSSERTGLLLPQVPDLIPTVTKRCEEVVQWVRDLPDPDIAPFSNKLQSVCDDLRLRLAEIGS